MFNNKSNRAPLQKILSTSLITSFIFTAILEAKNFYMDKQPFEWEIALVTFLLFGFLASVMNFFTLKNKENN